MSEYTEICPFYEDAEVQEALSDWEKCRKAKKCISSPRAIKRYLKDLMEYSLGNRETAIKIIDQSVDGGLNGPYTKLYSLKEVSFFKTQQPQQTPTQKRYPDVSQQEWYKEAQHG